MKLASLFNRTAPAVVVAFVLCPTFATRASAYVQMDLVSNIPGLAAITDPSLANPWGVARSGTSPFWLSNQGTNTSTLYSVIDGTKVSKVNINPPSGYVAIPTTASGPQGPTGQVNNGNAASFPVDNGGNGGSAHFIFANLNGTISAWDAGTTAFTQATTASAVYTGLAINKAQTMLYAANDAGIGSINVFNNSFAPVTLPAGAFANPFPGTGLVPFNVKDINGTVYVTYAPSGRLGQSGAALGAGAVAVFDENGTLIKALINGGQLAAPWGVALAPSDFGDFSNDLLIGNYSYLHSEINAFDPTTGAFLGTIPIDPGSGNSAGGLWDLSFGNGGNGGSPDVLYFADGINGEADGLFAALSVPEPSGLTLLASALGILAVWRKGFRRHA